MKKYVLLGTILLSLCACSAYHTGKIGMNVNDDAVEFYPKQISLNVDSSSKISGSAECTSLFWIFNLTPEKQAYGVNLQTDSGVIASDECVAAAIYDAMSKTNADVIVAPQYTTVRDGLLCFGYRCLGGTTKVIVKGYSGKISNIHDMDKDMALAKIKNTSAIKTNYKSSFLNIF